MLEIAEPGVGEIHDRLATGLEVAASREPELFPSEPPRPLRGGRVRSGPIARSATEAKLKSPDRAASGNSPDRGLWTLIWRAEEEQRFNPALLAKLEDHFDLTLQLPGDDELQPRQLIQSISGQVARMGWHVQARTVLSIFTFHKEPALRDRVANEALVLTNEAVGGVGIGCDAGTSFDFEPVDEAELDRTAPPERVVTILDADSSRRRASAAVGVGKSFAMDGPPGTGKSQTVANVIADLLTRRKNALFVSEEAAALDVVYV